MKVEVFKLYDDNSKLFDTVSTPSVSYISKGFPPDGKFNSGDIDNTGFEIENKFDSNGSEYNLGSSIKNIVLDYEGPQFVHDYSSYTSIKIDGTASVHIKLELSDALGLDCHKFQIGFFYGTEKESVLYESKHVFDEESIPAGEINWYTQFNYAYDGSLKPIVETEGENLVTYDGNWFIYSNGNNENYYVDFNINLSGDSTEGALGLAYKDLSKGIYQTYEEFNSGNLFIKVWDLAGNAYVFTGLKPLIYIPWTYEEFADLLEQLELYFYDTYPANMFLGENVIGKTTILVKNTNKEISEKYGLETILKLDNDSIGYLADITKIVDDYDLTEDVDGIDSVGYVKAFAYLYSYVLDVDITNFIRAETLVKGSLGPWVKECEDNTRKISEERYVPDFAKGSKLHEFMKFLVTFLNTAWCPLDKDCRIGLLEKIARIGDFNDIDKIEYPAISYWSDDRGNELDFDKSAIEAICSMSKRYSKLDNDVESCIRTLYRKLPAINMYKGTIDCFNILFNTLGIQADLIPLWSKNTGEGSEIWLPEYYYNKDKNNPEAWNPQIDDTYYLSSHLELRVSGYLAYDLIDIASSLVKLAKSILPVVRVIEHLLVEEYSHSSNCLALGYFDASTSFADNENVLQCISFLWDCNSWKTKRCPDGSIKIMIPQIAKRCCVDGATWWAGFNKTGIVSDPAYRNNATRNVTKFFNMLKRTLSNSDLYLYLDYAMGVEGLPETDYLTKIKPLAFAKLEVSEINWDSGYMIVIVKENSSDYIARLSTADYVQATFVFNRVSKLCYTTNLTTALNSPVIADGTVKLPGYKPFTWIKYKNELI